MGLTTDDTTPLYFADELFRFQTYISGRYEIGPHRIVWLTNVQDMAPVWDDYRGRDVLVGITGTIDNRHPDLRANYHAPYLAHHDPQDDIAEGSNAWGTAMAGIVAADDNGRGLVGLAPDAAVFEFTGHSREAPDVLVMGGQRLPYQDASGLLDSVLDSGGRGGLGRVVVAQSPGPDEFRIFFGLRDDPLQGFDESVGYVGYNQHLRGWANSQFAVHADRHVITADGATMNGAFPFGSGVAGAMTLVSAPVGGSAYWGIFDPGNGLSPTDPDFDPGYPDWNVAGDAVQTLVLDHRGDRGQQQAGESIGVFWSMLAQTALDVDVALDGDYTDAHGGKFASAVVGGAVALMLEAEPGLGWRDVQAILAYSANPLRGGQIPFLSKVEPNNGAIQWNSETNWNGGGLMFSEAGGFGGLDTRAAVRLAETWLDGGRAARTSANERAVTARLDPGQDELLSHQAVSNLFDRANNKDVLPFALEFTVPRAIDIEHVTLDVAFSGRPNSGGSQELAALMGFHVVSPEGQRSVVAGTADWGRLPQSTGFEDGGWVNELEFGFGSRAFLGQTTGAGDVWRVIVVPGQSLYGYEEVWTLLIESIALRFHGAPAGDDDVHVYTDAAVQMLTTDADAAQGWEGSIAAQSGHGGTLRDGRGRDTLNAAAMTADLALSAAPGGRGVAKDVEGHGDVTFYRLASDTAMAALIAGDGDDRLDGHTRGERLNGGRGDDHLRGKAGNDVLEGGPGDDRIEGGTGRDAASYEGAGAAVRVALASTERQDTQGAGRDRISGVEDLVGSDWDDDLAGSDRANAISGGAGDDKLRGHGDDDRLFGKAGDDWMDGGDGDDYLSGLDGDDRLFGKGGGDDLCGGDGDDHLSGLTGRDRLDGGRGDDELHGGSASDVLLGKQGTDRLYGGDGDDHLSGLTGRDRLFGGAGDDRLDGGDHNDHLSGGSGRDVLLGKAGDDRMWGGSGDDYLSGLDGRDRLEGDEGNDVLRGGRDADVFAFGASDGTDRVLDFENGVDRIEIEGGARRYADLRVRDAGDDVVIRFADTVIVLADEHFGGIGASDFLFS